MPKKALILIIASCPPRPAIELGTYNDISCQQNRSDPGTLCVVTCDGYVLEGNNEWNCLRNGTWDTEEISVCRGIC